jgi:hypothetical protein
MQPGITPEEYLLGDTVCTIGRWPSCTIVVQGPLISRLHAKIEPQGPRYVLNDAGSVNGTFVNGQRISEPYLLASDDLIALGAPAPPLLRFIDPDPTRHAGGSLRFDERAMVFSLAGQPLDLTPSQFKLLLHLYRHRGEVCSRESCAQAIWGRDYVPGMDAGALDQAFNGLRRALRQADPQASLIQTRRGLGYELTL